MRDSTDFIEAIAIESDAKAFAKELRSNWSWSVPLYEARSHRKKELYRRMMKLSKRDPRLRHFIDKNVYDALMDLYVLPPFGFFPKNPEGWFVPALKLHGVEADILASALRHCPCTLCNLIRGAAPYDPLDAPGCPTERHIRGNFPGIIVKFLKDHIGRR